MPCHIVSHLQHVMNNGAELAVYCQILVECRDNKRSVNCERGRFPIAAGFDDLLGQRADVRTNWQSGGRRPDADNVEQEVTYDAH